MSQGILKRTRAQLPEKEPIREGKPKAGRRYVLYSQAVSPVLSPIFSYLPQEFVGALSYEGCVALNRAYSMVMADKVEAIGGAYKRDEHLMWSLLLSKRVIGELYKELRVWLETEAPEASHPNTFHRVVRYCMIFHLADHALTSLEVREATNTTSVFITMSQMRNADLLERAAKVRMQTDEGDKKLATFILTKKGKTFVSLTCDILERKENTLRAVLKTKK